MIRRRKFCTIREITNKIGYKYDTIRNHVKILEMCDLVRYKEPYQWGHPKIYYATPKEEITERGMGFKSKWRGSSFLRKNNYSIRV